MYGSQALLRRAVIGLTVAALAWMMPATADAGALVEIACGDTITSSIKVANDLADCPGDGLHIAASNVTLDLNGHTVDGSSTLFSQGITATGVQKIAVKNGTVRQFDFGVDLHNVSDAKITGIVAHQTSDGISVSGSHFVTVQGNRSTASGDAIHFLSGSDNLAQSNEVGRSYAGIVISSPNSVAKSNKVFDNATGIRVDPAEDITVSGNDVRANTGHGIEVDASAVDTVVSGNTASLNGESGILIDSASTTVAKNTANNNAGLGIDGVFGVTDGGGNKAAANDLGSQCTYVSCAGQPMATNVSCGQVLSKSVKLNGNLMGCSDGLLVSASNVTIDLNGFSIVGDTNNTDTAISSFGGSGIRIKNGTIRHFGSGIFFQSVTNSRIEDLTIHDSEDFGIYPRESNAIIQDNWISGTRANTSEAIYVLGTADPCNKCKNPLLKGNTVVGNAGSGMTLAATENVTVAENVVRYNLRSGIVALGPGDTGLDLVDNDLTANVENGISTDASVVAPVYDGNTAQQNGIDGMHAWGGAPVFSDNTARDNGALGIEAPATADDEGGNVATGNENASQCLNVCG